MAGTLTTEVTSEKGSIWIFKRVLQDDVNYENLTPVSEFVNKETQAKIIKSWSEYDEEPSKKKENDKIKKENENLKQNGKKEKPLKTRKWASWLNVRLDKKYTELAQIWDPQNKQKDQSVENYDWSSVPLKWQKSFFAQQEAMLIKFSGSNFKIMEFGRDKEHFMDFISGLVKPLGVVKKDAWNPADIWIVDKRKENNIEKGLKDTVSFGPGETADSSIEKKIKLQQLNKVLRTLYASKTIIGVSLKLTSLKADYVDVNIVLNQSGLDESATQKRFQDIENLLCDISSIKCDLTLKPFVTDPPDSSYKKAIKEIQRFNKLYQDYYYPKNPLSFANKGSIIEIIEPDTKKEYQLTIQATSTSHVNNLKYEPVEKGKASARLGKAPVDQVSDLFKEYKIDFVNDQKKYPKDFNDPEVDKLISKFNKVKNASGFGNKVYTGINTMQQFKDNLKEVFLSDIATAHSKLMQLDLLTQIMDLETHQLKKLLTDMVYLAKKEGKAYGPFGKVY
jgi:uncharacterized protein YbaA (DUF1428 family)